MHNLNVLILGPSSFISTLNELAKFLKFNFTLEHLNNDPNIILFHEDALKNKKHKDFIENKKTIKICVGKKEDLSNKYDASLVLPATIKELNAVVENTFAKNIFNKNSSIEVKSYLLNKNEKKLSKLNDFIILTEKEVQLIELFFRCRYSYSWNAYL